MLLSVQLNLQLELNVTDVELVLNVTKRTSDFAFNGRGTMRADDAHGTPTQSHISPSIILQEEHC